ncbi:MAG: hypothetical protein Q7J86_12350 [Bacteroidota bacterium]|nr:hypothetical protein [Bacteroidota bacterium]MDO9615299.1 hypothetical protein [Bacteroidota bacterium]
MESQRINILLQKYFEAETTLAEENELITYFTSGEVDENLKMYVPMFSGIKELSVDENPGLGDDLMNYILESEHREKLRYRWMWQMVTGIAASVILVMLAVNFYSNQNQWHDTFTDPDEAYAEATKTLEFVAGKYNKGMAQLNPIGKMEDATIPFYSGMEALDKGFKKLYEIENLNKNLKNE